MVQRQAWGHLTVTRQRNGKNGIDGKTAYHINLTNDTDTIQTDEKGNVTGEYPTTTAQLFEGSRMLDNSLVAWSCNATNCTASINASGVVTISAMTGGASVKSAKVIIYGRYNNITYNKEFKFKKLFGQPKNWLEFSRDTVGYNPQDKAYDPTSLTVYAYRLHNGTKSNITAASGYGHIIINGRTDINPIYNGQSITIANLITTYGTTNDGFLFELYSGTTHEGTPELLDREFIPIVRDGEKGKGIAITLQRNGLYTDANWNTYATIGGDTSFTKRTGDSDFTSVSVGDIFMVTGKASDSTIFHEATYKCTAVTGSQLTGTCISHIKDGAKGSDSVILGMDNANDSFIYDGNGNRISNAIESQGYLYEGGNLVTSNITWSIDTDQTSGVTVNNNGEATSPSQSYTGKTACWITTGGKLKVNGITASGQVMVRAYYKNTYHYCRVTLKRLDNTDKYQIIATPSGIAYNSTTDNPATTQISVNIWKTTVKGERVLSAPPTGYKTYVFDGNSYLSSSSSSASFTYTSDNSERSSVRLVIANSTDLAAETTVILDDETIPIAKSSNGQQGNPGAEGKGYKAVVQRNNFTTANWNTYGTTNHEETWGSTSTIRNGCREGDWFLVVGRATDAAAYHELTYLCDNATGDLHGKCIGHKVTADGQPGDPGNPGNPGADGNDSFTIYKNAFSKPATPTPSTYTNNGWTRSPAIQDNIGISHGGSWTQNPDGAFQSPATGNNEAFEERFELLTTAANQTLNLEIEASSESNYDKGYIGAIDNGDAYSNNNAVVSGQQKQAVSLTIQTAGKHYIIVSYKKDASTIGNKDCAYVKIGKMPTWMSTALGFDENGNPTLFSEPVPITDTKAQGDTMPANPNILNQTRFKNSMRMYAWLSHNGEIKDGVGSSRSYYGEAKQEAQHYLLQQILWNGEVDNLKNDTWYTLSFWAKGSYINTFVYPTAANTDQPYYIDDAYIGNAPSDLGIRWQLNSQCWRRHTITFKTKALYATGQKFSQEIKLLFRQETAGDYAYILMPKLEEGMQATSYQFNEEDIEGLTGKLLYPAGAYDSGKAYTSDEYTAPVVSKNVGGNTYYYWLDAPSSTGEDPATSKKWKKANHFQLVITEALMANFGKLAAAVFWGNFMFSQYGLVDGESSRDYTKFDALNPDEEGRTDRFAPNLYLNFLTGAARLAAGKAKFNANGSAELAGGNISWNPAGKTRIKGLVNASLMYADTKEISASYTINPETEPYYCYKVIANIDIELLITLPNATTYDGLELRFFSEYKTRMSSVGVLYYSGGISIRGTTTPTTVTATKVALDANRFVTVKAMNGGWYVVSGEVQSIV